jgi:Uma2 family endonuclease
MSAPATAAPAARPYYMSQVGFRKFTLDEYHRMIENGVLTDGEPYELLEGNLVLKMSRGNAHDSALQALAEQFYRVVFAGPAGWSVRGQSAVTLPPDGSEPEPDLAVVRGNATTYRDHHPGPGEIGLLVEVADSSLLVDRHDKGRIYARAGVPVYWVVNVVDKVIEVYTQPSGPTAAPAYARRDDYPPGTAVPVVLDGATVGTVAVAEVVG